MDNNERFDLLMNKVNEQTERVIFMLNNSIKALKSRNSVSLEKIIDHDENLVNLTEVEIEKTCVEILEDENLKGRKLRTVLTIIKINNTIERIADHVVNICHAIKFLNENPMIKPLLEVDSVSDIACFMLARTVKAFVDSNVESCYKTIKKDVEIDVIVHREFINLSEFIRKYPDTVKSVQRIIYIMNNIERIGDLCKNICEEIIFAEQGRIIRHSNCFENYNESV